MFQRRSDETYYSLLAKGTKLMGGLVIKARSATSLSILLLVTLIVCLLPAGTIEPALANPGKLMWSIVDTPAPGVADKNVIVSPSEINVIAIGSDDTTFYAIDIPGDPPAGP